MAHSFGDAKCFEILCEELPKIAESVRPTFALLFELYMVQNVIKNANWYLTNAVMSIEAMKNLDAHMHVLIKMIQPMNQQIVRSFGIPEHLVTAPAAQDFQAFNDGYFFLSKT